MTTTMTATASHRQSLFSTLSAWLMQAFDALHDANWSAPWAATARR